MIEIERTPTVAEQAAICGACCLTECNERRQTCGLRRIMPPSWLQAHPVIRDKPSKATKRKRNREACRKWYAKNREKVSERKKQYYAENQQKLIEKQREYRARTA